MFPKVWNITFRLKNKGDRLICHPVEPSVHREKPRSHNFTENVRDDKSVRLMHTSSHSCGESTNALASHRFVVVSQSSRRSALSQSDSKASRAAALIRA